MKYLFIWFVILFLGCGLGCAHVKDAMSVFEAGQQEIQEMVDETQAFCQYARERLKERDLDTASLEAYCEKAWSHFKTYKKLTDPILQD